MFAEGYAKARLYAKGRMKSGQMNRTEKAYAAWLEAEKHAGRIMAYWFEALKLKIAEGACFYTPDFLVLRPDGTLELHEVKGSPAIFADDAKVKVKACATQYPFPVFVVSQRKKFRRWLGCPVLLRMFSMARTKNRDLNFAARRCSSSPCSRRRQSENSANWKLGKGEVPRRSNFKSSVRISLALS